jgi:hypothetical protein
MCFPQNNYTNIFIFNFIPDPHFECNNINNDILHCYLYNNNIIYTVNINIVTILMKLFTKKQT